MSQRFRSSVVWACVLALILVAWWLREADVAHVGGLGQTGIGDYEQARRLFWTQLYADGGETLYCGVPFDAQARPGINIEHVFPMAWVTSALGCGDRDQCRVSSRDFNLIEADLHNLYPARADVNKARGAMRFGRTDGVEPWSPDCDIGIDRRARVVQPRPAARGEIARAMFYMREVYGLEIFRTQGEVLKQWHLTDPVSDEERRRNEIIEALQGTRNLYIDEPERAAGIRF